MFFLFSLPIFLWVNEKKGPAIEKLSLKKAYRDVWIGISETKKYPGILRFLIADYFFEDAAMTVILNIGIYCSIVIGLTETEITRFLIISTFSAVVGSFILGKIAQIWSLKKMINLIIFGWIIALVLFIINQSMIGLWILGSVIGVLLGGLWTTTRPFLAELVPRHELGRFFGLFALSGRAAAIIGPIIWTVVVYWFNSDRVFGKNMIKMFDIGPENYISIPYKVAILSLAVMMLVGLFIFRKVPNTGKDSDG